MTDDLRARLEGHAKAFEGMMSLIPAKYYYGQDNDDQWQRKKQTKEEKRAARMAKLDPANYKSALDVHKENERKRKRELDDEEEINKPGEGTEKPKEGLKKWQKSSKKPKLDDIEIDASSQPKKVELTPEEDAKVRKEKAEKRRIKRDRKKEKKQKSIEAREAKKSQKQQEVTKKPDAATSSGRRSEAPIPTKKSQDNAKKSRSARSPANTASVSKPSVPLQAGQEDSDDSEDANEDDERAEDDNEELDETLKFDINGFGDDQEPHSDENPYPESASSASAADTPTFDTSQRHSSASSSSSIVPPSEPEITKASGPIGSQDEPFNLEQPLPHKLTVNTTLVSQTQFPISADQHFPNGKHPKLPHFDPERLKERLESRLAALRAARKADGPDGRPAKNRQDLIEARRQKQEKRKQHKKEIRNQAKKENDAEAEAARLRGGSGSPMWSPAAVLSPREQPNNFSFGKVAFADGAEMDTSQGGIVDAKKKKGPQDPKTALEAAERKQSRLSGLDTDKRKNIEEKDRWLNAKKRVQGEKVRDDTSLLKKTLKRKEHGKAKSEKEWNERIEGVTKGKEAKQKRREDNLKKRRDEKGGGAKKGKKPPPKPRARPGFEGSWRLGTKKA